MNKIKDELYRYRHEVHCYLDVLWLISTNKCKARNIWYNYLAVNLNKSEDENHISKYSLEDCKKALRLLKSKYKQLTGRNNIPKIIINKFHKNKSKKYNKELIMNSLNYNNIAI